MHLSLIKNIKLKTENNLTFNFEKMSYLKN